MAKNDTIQLEGRKRDGSQTISDLSGDAVEEISSNLRRLLADVFALYVKTKNFHWHMSGRHFRDYHLLLDEHATQIFAMTDDVAERARKAAGNDRRAVRGQPAVDAEFASRTRDLRPAQRCRYRQLDRGMDRRERAPDLVFIRDSSRSLRSAKHLITHGLPGSFI